MQMVKIRCDNGSFIPPIHRADMTLSFFFINSN